MPWRRCSVFLLASFFVASIATASPIFTFLPESSAPYPCPPCVGGGQTADPLGPTIGLRVAYLGIGTGGSSEQLNGAHLVYRFRLDFLEPAEINSISMVGWGDHNSGGSNAVMRLLDSSYQVLSTSPLTDWNVQGTWTLNGNGATGTTFYYDEFDYSGVIRVRDALTVDSTPVPEPASLLLLGTGLVGMVGAARRRMRK